ncbi:MAG: SDR family oxidoreductase [Acidimicrobiales bacterium]
MDDVLQYEGKTVVVTGAASGMGAATTAILVELGAKVIALDIKPVASAVERSIECNLGDEASIDAAIAAIEGPVDALLCCAGLPGPPFSELDVFTVNFIGGRHLIEGMVATKVARGGSVGWIASAAGAGWQLRVDMFRGLLETPGFGAAQQWFLEHPEAGAFMAYTGSKWAINIYTAWRSHDFIRDNGVRLNCLNPGPTDTAMMPSFVETNTLDAIDQAQGSIGRHSTADEQAWPLVMLCSPRLSYVAGEALWVDGGYIGPMTTGRIEGYNFLLEPL